MLCDITIYIVVRYKNVYHIVCGFFFKIEMNRCYMYEQ